jgi:hypothetical protein
MRKLRIAFFGELSLEKVMDLSQDILLDLILTTSKVFPLNSINRLVLGKGDSAACLS